jgi:hypothetical protein
MPSTGVLAGDTGAGPEATAGSAGPPTPASDAALGGDAFFAATFLVGAGAAAPPSVAAFCGKASFNLRTTGGSTVDDADRTNSPSSWSLAMTTLLSTPNSLASS